MTDNATTPRRGRPPRLTRDQILATALRLVDERGLEHLTMRRLGAALGVDPMAVYRHVADKSALYDGLVEAVFAEVEVPEQTGDWEADLRAATRAGRIALLAHPNVVPLIGTRPPVTESAFVLMEAVTTMLLAAGLGEEAAADGFDCVGRLVVGHVLAEGGRPPGGDVDGGEQQHLNAQQTLPAERFPAIARVQNAHVTHDAERLFELALDGLVLALARRTGTAQPRGRA